MVSRVSRVFREKRKGGRRSGNTCPEYVPGTMARGDERKIGAAHWDGREAFEITCEVAIHAIAPIWNGSYPWNAFFRSSARFDFERIRRYKSFFSYLLSYLEFLALYKKNTVKYADWLPTTRKAPEIASKNEDPVLAFARRISEWRENCNARARVRTSSACTIRQRNATQRNPTTKRASGGRIRYERRGEKRRGKTRGEERKGEESGEGCAEETRGVRKGARGKVPSEWWWGSEFCRRSRHSAASVVVGKTNPWGVAEGTSVDERLFQVTALLALRPELSSCTSSTRSSAASSAYRQCRDVATSTRLREGERRKEVSSVRK